MQKIVDGSRFRGMGDYYIHRLAHIGFHATQ